ELRQLEGDDVTVGRHAVEYVVLGGESTGGERAPSGGDCLHLPPQRDLFVQESIARGSVLPRLSAERDSHRAPSLGPGRLDRKQGEVDFEIPDGAFGGADRKFVCINVISARKAN